MKKHEKPIVSAQGDHEKIRRCIVSGFFANAAKLAPDGSYRTIKDNYPVNIHPNSVLFRGAPPPVVIFHENVVTTKEFMREVSVIDQKWLIELAPHFYEYQRPIHHTTTTPSVSRVGNDEVVEENGRLVKHRRIF
eukprot:TRINITY_DN413_c0_g1_i4.p1 TRINITY_DN413_c0_g1~~TRINITY_DN413_c0_g1_i4.p1  ORF type:complete len:135 (-),score=28.20 TRINITY_DN413_c0_g1_i4:45-449(-)